MLSKSLSSPHVRSTRRRAAPLAALVSLGAVALLWLAPGALAQVSFSAPTTFAAGGASPLSVAVGDFNADSDPDLAVANQTSPTVSVLLGGAGGSFGTATSIFSGDLPQSVAVGDFNADSDPDLAVANAGSDDVSVFLGGAGGSFGTPTRFAVGDSPQSVAVGDFNADSDLDLAVANALSDEVSVLLGGAGGSFGTATSFAVGDFDFAVSVAVGDFNADSDPDLAVAGLAGDVSVLLGGTGGSFGAATSFAVGDFANSVAVGDFNADSDPDLAVTNNGGVSVLLGGAGASFGAPTSFAAGGSPQSVAVGDFNADSDPDLAVANLDSDDVSVLLGGAGGSFGTATNFDAGGSPTSVALGDFNADSDPDLAVANQLFVGTVSVLLNTFNRAPSAADDSYSTDEDTPLPVTAPGVLDNDSDPDGDTLTAVLVSGPTHGTLAPNADGSFDYTPAANFNGSDSFTYRASDGSLESNVAKVSITVTPVNDAPSAADDSYGTDEDTPLPVTAPGVLDNDSDPDGDTLTAVLVSGPTHGTLAPNADGSFDYTPAANFNGSDSFTYRASDGSLESNVAKVSITVTPVNDAPSAADDSYGTDEDTPLPVTAPGVLDNDSDPDGDTLTAVLVSGPTHGTLAPNADGSFDYTPAANFNGSDSFTYRASDGSLESNVAKVSITVTPVNDAPSAADDSYGTDEDTPLPVTAPGVLDNDSDPDGDTLTAVLVSGPTHGTLAPNADGSFDYTPAANFNGSDSFTYRASDGSLESNVAKVSITVTPVNDAPLARVVSGGTCSGSAVAATLKLSVTDPDTGANPTLSATSSDTTIATATIGGSSANPTVTITGRKAGTATVTITADDGAGGITSDAITVWVGSNGAETITGGARSDLIFGVNGRDTLSGAGGADYICSGNGNGTAAGGDGDDTIHGQNGDDVMRGEAGNDVLTGGKGADRFSGGPGTDTATDLTPSQGDTQDGTIP